jgi:hypothetical protein
MLRVSAVGEDGGEVLVLLRPISCCEEGVNTAQLLLYADGCAVGYSDYDVFLENDEGSRVYRCKKLF